ncbi:neutral/alkaline non-lysosomal ceramidase N-terminal domain-containing protein [Fictibacillus enclensis]|uniref:neutral/alkaline non-lysosomal ceramidase N-terminal domain-containing protein n=1 Tax=Fictibacillus enclensis TaxID=1017270 RepID=UPI0025A08716|nr:neutral/alkaline non-lysosomal ceramidase N-terminal domain-containing protein [Fictibacillus enclensis]MDM5340522.1 neutral/alkaline non-lysosomal ceramidase N-terminal domain-containing protein [Fictibacillus enclensis]
MMQLFLGTSKVDITPEHPIELAGYAHRQTPSEDVKSRLYLRAFYFAWHQGKEETKQAVLLIGDLIWWGSDYVSLLKREIKKEWGIEWDAIILHATHNHSGPQTSSHFTAYLGKADEHYLEFLKLQLREAIESARNNTEAVAIKRAATTCHIGMNRRRSDHGKIVMAPNRDGVIDSEVVLLKFLTASGNMKALLTHYTCHPTTTGDNAISSEFPGHAMAVLEESYNQGFIAGYLQGCCGDIRPALIKEGEFYRGKQEDIERLGMKLAKKIDGVLTNGQWSKVEVEEFQVHSSEIRLAFYDQPCFEDTIQPVELKSEWKRAVQKKFYLGQGNTVPLRMTLWKISSNLSFLTFNAEVVAEYGLQLKEKYDGKIIPLPYSNGMIGYVPTANQISEGGYEAIESCSYFALPSPFSKEIEMEIYRGIDELILKGERLSNGIQP